ncbi:DUF1351 domain-containing protein [Lacticaseibacillus sp. 866-1]|uniref:DUF1351 domain-containing protein n=1 Tax=Lacticaseibacillus sp. 866-1 TaxID=2799576 RepID=UPI001943C46A|nr:DUF1351 domain-containing protein [Lacticaseibacillus sp. 866-1]
MTNELTAPQDLKYQVDYKPSTITINNYDDLKAQVAAYASKYSNLVVTDGTLKDAQDSLAKLRKFKTAIDNQRKEVKKQYNQPLHDFENQVKALTGEIDATIVPIDAAVKTLQKSAEDERHNKLLAYIAELAPSYKIDVTDVELEDGWDKVNMWTPTGKPTIGLTRAIGSKLKSMVDQRERIASDKAATKAYADANNLDAYSWLQEIEAGATFAELRVRMDAALMQRKKDEERAQRAKEAADAIAKAKQEQVGNTTIDRETGEIVPQPEQTSLIDEEPQQQAPVYTRAFRVTTTEEKMWALADFMKANKISYESIKEA